MLRFNPLIHVTTEFGKPPVSTSPTAIIIPFGIPNLYIYIYTGAISQRQTSPRTFHPRQRERESGRDRKRLSRRNESHRFDRCFPSFRKAKTVEVTRSHPLSVRLLSRRRLATAASRVAPSLPITRKQTVAIVGTRQWRCATAVTLRQSATPPSPVWCLRSRGSTGRVNAWRWWIVNRVSRWTGRADPRGHFRCVCFDSKFPVKLVTGTAAALFVRSHQESRQACWIFDIVLWR